VASWLDDFKVHLGVHRCAGLIGAQRDGSMPLLPQG
jgi:hypothetical protein